MASLSEQLVKYLTDVHAMEVQALAQMRAAPKLAGPLAGAFEAHREETERHEALIRRRLDAHDASPSRIEDLLGAVSGKGFVLFARFNPDTPGKLATHAFSYEHLELAAYELLERVAQRAGDAETADAARQIRGEEEAMAARIGAAWDRTVEASLGEKDPDDLGEQLNKYLADAHALEAQAIKLLERGPEIAGDLPLAAIMQEHLAESRAHQAAVEQRLKARGGKPSALQDAALRLGALSWSTFFGAQKDTPAKLAAFAYAFEHLEIGGYEQLARVAQRAGDIDTAHTAKRILAEERAAAEKLYGTFESALEASLEAVLSR